MRIKGLVLLLQAALAGISRSETQSPTELEAPGCYRHMPGTSGPPGDHMGGWGFLAVC